jgi:hypothetical protein
MNKAEEILKKHTNINRDWVDCNVYDILEAMEEYATQCQEECNIICPKCGGDSWKFNGIKTTIKHCKCGNDF